MGSKIGKRLFDWIFILQDCEQKLVPRQEPKPLSFSSMVGTELETRYPRGTSSETSESTLWRVFCNIWHGELNSVKESKGRPGYPCVSTAILSSDGQTTGRHLLISQCLLGACCVLGTGDIGIEETKATPCLPEAICFSAIGMHGLIFFLADLAFVSLTKVATKIPLYYFCLLAFRCGLVEPRLTSNLLWTWGRPRTPNLSASISRVLGSQARAIIPSSFDTRVSPWSHMCGRRAPCKRSCLLKLPVSILAGIAMGREGVQAGELSIKTR